MVGYVIIKKPITAKVTATRKKYVSDVFIELLCYIRRTYSSCNVSSSVKNHKNMHRT